MTSFCVPTAAFDVVAIATSAGGLRALTVVLSALPADFPAAILVVQHLDPRHCSMMADILSRVSKLPVKQAVEGESLRGGTVVVAPPNRHLLVSAEGTLHLSETELVHFVRPSADILFESVASAFESRALGVVLTGSGRDGSTGARAIKKTGGTLIAQEAASSEFSGMPTAAAETGLVDFIVRLDQVAPTLIKLVTPGEEA